MSVAEETPTAGAVYFESQDVHRIPRAELHRLRRKIGTVFQEYRLIPSKTAFENIAFAMEASGRTDDEIAADVPHVLELVDLTDKAWNFPSELSGGERQRVAIARALANNPPIILADEPTGRLDSKSGELVLDLLDQLRRERGLTVVMVTHESHVAERADRIVRMLDGCVETSDVGATSGARG